MPSKNLLEDAIQIGKVWAVGEAWKAVISNDEIDLFLRLALGIGEQCHCKEKCVEGRHALRVRAQISGLWSERI
jgi:hypothetical protein